MIRALVFSIVYLLGSGVNAVDDSAVDYIEVETGVAPEYAVIWLHGLGADGNDFRPLVPELAIPGQFAVRFVFPHAPYRAITINGGMVMRGWYDIASTDIAGREDAAGIEASAAIVAQLIAEQQQRGIASDHIILAGFSQGGAIALFAGVRHAQPLGGILALSAYMPLPGRVAAERHLANRDIAIFMAHGQYDPVVPLALGESSRDALTNMGYRIEWQTYPMQHSVSIEEIQDIGVWIRQQLFESLSTSQ
ncbi:MAG: alpha/beta hydrolase [Gammaproteobacteria bacterium]|nr:alpha/beta hydrolase [Gammaproteobacteria bacterium]